MDPIKEAFERVRQDIEYLYQEISEIKSLLSELRSQQSNKPTNQQYFPTDKTNSPTLQQPYNGLITSKTSFSTGSDGVPTNNQTNQQTIQHPFISTETGTISSVNDRISNLKRVSEILGTLDDLKKEVRLKFKKLTEQEMLVFGTIYQLEEQGFVVDYNIIAQKTGLTEISIRDYVRKIINKGIPLNKLKESNKKVILSIPEDLKRIASLATISQLRSL